MTIEMLLSRQELARRWGTSMKTVDRLRNSGKLAWIDIAGGRGTRPLVRFHLRDLERFEQSMRRSSEDNTFVEESSHD
jgi:hypothetical protein